MKTEVIIDRRLAVKVANTELYTRSAVEYFIKSAYNLALEDAIKHFKENDSNGFRFIINDLTSLKK